MSISARIIKPRFIRNLSLTEDKAWNPFLWNLRGSQSETGENVNEQTALTFSAVWSAVSQIAGTVSSLPLHLQRKDGQRTVILSEKPLYNVLHSRANISMTAQICREVIMLYLLTWGNAYCEKIYNPLGDIVGLWPIAPDRVTPELVGNELVYHIKIGSEIVTLNRFNILHIPGLGYDGLMGYSVIAMARKSIGLGMALDTFASKYFSQGTHPGAVITHPATMKDPKAFREAMANVYEGLGNTHRLMLLQEGMKLEKVTIPPEDSQFLESREFHIPEIARWFNIPPHKLKDLSKSSFNNIESEQTSYVIDCILPWLIRLEQNYNMQLLTSAEVKRNTYFRHNVDGQLRGNAKDRATYYRTMFGIGAMSINDIRDKEGWDVVDGGDERFVPLNMIPLSRVEEYVESIVNKQQAVKKSNIITESGGKDNEA